ncbi:MAG: ABC transporter substrate-binding protein [Pseudomonadota bacterium]
MNTLRGAIVTLGMLLLTGAAQAAEKITVAALPFVSSAPLFIAQDRGYYADEGLEVELKFFRAAQPVAVAIASGDADFGVTAFTGGFFNLAGKGALKVIGAQSREEPGFEFSGYLVSNQAFEDGFTDPQGFQGRSLGMTTTGSSFHYMIGQLVDAMGWQDDDVTLRPLQSVPNMIGAVKSGQVDAIILPAHIIKALEGGGAGRIVGWVHERTPYQLGGLFTSTQNVNERPELVEKFVRAYQRAATDYHNAMNQVDDKGERVFGEDADAIIDILMNYVGPNPTPEKIQNGAPYIDSMGRLDVGNVHEQVAWYQERGLVDASVDPADLIELRFVEGHFNLPESPHERLRPSARAASSQPLL